jgi:hypothetical protein
MAAAAPMTTRARLVVGLAVTGAVPLTVGVIVWIIGSVLGLAHRGAADPAVVVGEFLMLAGLLFGLAVIVLAIAGARARPLSAATRSGGNVRGEQGLPEQGLPEQGLLPLASPEQQAFLADPPPPPYVPPPPANPPYPPVEETYRPDWEAYPPPAGQPPAGHQPSAGQWPQQAMPGAWTSPPGPPAVPGPPGQGFFPDRGFPADPWQSYDAGVPAWPAQDGPPSWPGIPYPPGL